MRCRVGKNRFYRKMLRSVGGQVAQVGWVEVLKKQSQQTVVGREKKMSLMAGGDEAEFGLVHSIDTDEVDRAFGELPPYILYHKCPLHDVERLYVVRNIHQLYFGRAAEQRAFECAGVKVLCAKIRRKRNQLHINPMFSGERPGNYPLRFYV